MFRLFLLPLLLLVLPAGLRGAESAELARRAAELDRNLKAAQALELYLLIEKEDPGNADVLIGIARQYRHLMADEPDKAEKLRLCELALVYGERAADAAPGNSDAQLSVAITCGKMLKLKSAREQVGVSRRIKESVDRALRLDPNNDLAWHIFGRWHQGYAELSPVRRAMGELLFGSLPKSTNEEAARCFEKAMEANPRRLMHPLELGMTYARMGRTDDARRLLRKGLSMANTEKDDPEVKVRARSTLKALGEAGEVMEVSTSR